MALTVENPYFTETEHSYMVEGKARVLKAGNILRVARYAFGDAVILGFNSRGDCKVSRPYAYASLVGTTCAHPLLGEETFTIFDTQVGCYELVDGDTRIT